MFAVNSTSRVLMSINRVLLAHTGTVRLASVSTECRPMLPYRRSLLSGLGPRVQTTPYPILRYDAELSSLAAESGGFGGQPSAKQLKYARDLAAENGTVVPPEVDSSSMTISAFIDSLLDSNPRPPSIKQIDFVNSLAEERGLVVPAEALRDYRVASRFIDECLGNASESPSEVSEPTLKQLGLAARLARDCNEGIPAEALLSKSSMSAFIDSLQVRPETRRRCFHPLVF
jgi:hypothetical protein